MKKATIALLWLLFPVLLFLAFMSAPGAPVIFGYQHIPLPSEAFPAARHDAGWRIDLTGLGLEHLTDDRTRLHSPVILLEDGVPLTPHIPPERLSADRPGSYTHWDHYVIFVPRHPLEATRTAERFVLLVPWQNRWPGLWWYGAALLAALGLAAAGRRRPARHPAAGLLVALLMVTAALAGHFYREWGTFVVAPDSPGYVAPYRLPSVRPPMYPFFIDMVVDRDAISPLPEDLPKNVPLDAASGTELLRVARVQKVLLGLTFLLFIGVLAGPASLPLAIWLGVFLVGRGFLSEQASQILSEPLTQAWALCLASVALAYTRHRNSGLLILAGILCALAFLTRPAAMFLGMLFLGMILAGLHNPGRRSLPWSAAAVLLAGAMVAAPGVWQARHADPEAASPIADMGRLGIAMNIAQPGDADIMPDAETRQYFSEAMARWSKHLAETGGDRLPPHMRIADASYGVALPLAMEMGYSFWHAHSLMRRVFIPLYKHHWPRLLRFYADSFRDATSVHSHFKRFFWPLCALILAAALAGRGRWGWMALMFLAAHFMHMLVVCTHDAPLPRYVHASDWLLPPALLLAAVALRERLGRLQG